MEGYIFYFILFYSYQTFYLTRVHAAGRLRLSAPVRAHLNASAARITPKLVFVSSDWLKVSGSIEP